MKILWITKIASKNLTGGTKVSWNYRQELSRFSDLKTIARIDLENNSSINKIEFIKIIFKLRKEKFDYVFFDDHYCSMSIFFINHNKKMFYHGNWPDLMFTSVLYFIKGLYLFPQYLLGIKLCQEVIFVNPYFEKRFSFLTKKTITLFNPLDIVIKERKDFNFNKNEILMVGNVDSRKYKNLIKLLKSNNVNDKKFIIYGKIIDKIIEKKLRFYSNVEFKGLVDRIPYENYLVHFNCSEAENLPLSLFESLKNGLMCIYPKSDNYSFMFGNSEIYFYEDIKKLESKNFMYSHNLISENMAYYLSATYKKNLEKLFNKKI